MLPAEHRLRSAADFTAVTRRGRRANSRSLVLYLLADPAVDSTVDRKLADKPSDTPVRAGLIVGRSVGGSVVRHRVSRRLRAQLASRLDRFPAGSRLVVRALPAAAEARSDELGRGLDQAARRLNAGAR